MYLKHYSSLLIGHFQVPKTSTSNHGKTIIEYDCNSQAMVVRRSVNTIYWINLYPVDNAILLSFIHWVPINLFDSVFQPLYNWAQENNE